MLKHGDTRPEDQFRFLRYRRRVSGERYEVWLSPAEFDRRDKRAKEHLARKRRELYADPVERAKVNDYMRERMRIKRRDDPVPLMISRLRLKCKKLNLDFNLTNDDVTIPKLCPALGIELKPAVGGKIHDGSPTIDRINLNKGYVKGNVIVVSHKANRIKSNATPSEILKVAQFYSTIFK